MNNSNLFHSPKGEDEQHAYHSKIEKKVDEVVSPFQKYIHDQATAGLLLGICTVIALIWASAPAISQSYQHFVSAKIGIYVSNFIVEKPLKFWVNDVLLTLFFFVVGLEIKREFLIGELADHRKSALIIVAAVGGMLFPAGIYFILNYNTPTQHGWGIPMATDTAFVLGILTLFRNKLPSGTFTFLTALAIIDDIGAILVIAIFYTSQLDPLMLFFATLGILTLAFFNFAGFRKPAPYLLGGLLIWACVEAAHIHGTVAGILVAFLIPARPRKGPNAFISRVKNLLNYFEQRKEQNPLVLEDQEQHAVLEKVQQAAEEATTPLQRWGSKLEMPIGLCVLPLFALVNAGVSFDIDLLDHVFTEYVSLGIILGLVVGKPLGITLFSWIAHKNNIGELPQNTDLRDVLSIGLLAGIGFTISLFIANLSFADPRTTVLAKAAIIIGSTLAAILGVAALFFLPEKSKLN